MLGLQVHEAWLFYLGAGDSDSGFHACPVSTFAPWTISWGPHDGFCDSLLPSEEAGDEFFANPEILYYEF